MTLIVVTFAVMMLWSHPVAANIDDGDSIARPQALMIIVTADNQVRVHVDLGMAQGMQEQWQVPAGSRVVDLPTSPLPVVVDALMLPVNQRRMLRFDGKPTVTPAPTATAYALHDPQPFMLNQAGEQVTLLIPADSGGMHRFVEVTCAGCDIDWVLPLVNQLPVHAPVVVFAPGTSEWPGLWRIQSRAVAGSDLPALAPAVTLFERTAESVVRPLSWQSTVTAVKQPPERFREVDGRTQLLRITLCLVGVLLCSLAGFYLAVAVMRRMHAAVGYRPDDRR
jgi:hypothetical protein